MKAKFLMAVWIVCGCLPLLGALPLNESIFTEIINEAKVVTESNKYGALAKENEIFKAPDLVRTGRDSRVELTAKDQTITRVGANTAFTFAESGREIQLKQGGVLFHSPAGAGGGAVKHRGSSAAVLGTTMIAQVLTGDRFKILSLEGRVKVTLVNGLSVTLKPGQMVIVSADGISFGAVANFNLGELASHALLIVGFSDPLSSRSLIANAIRQQNLELAAGNISNLMSWQDAALGLDIVMIPFNDSAFYLDLFSSEWNPLDFPGGDHVFVIVPLEFATGSIIPVIKPPVVTKTNPPVP